MYIIFTDDTTLVPGHRRTRCSRSILILRQYAARVVLAREAFINSRSNVAPSQVSAKNQEEVWQRLYDHDGKGVPKFRVSNRVRISKVKRLFEKGYMANWS